MVPLQGLPNSHHGSNICHFFVTLPNEGPHGKFFDPFDGQATQQKLPKKTSENALNRKGILNQQRQETYYIDLLDL